MPELASATVQTNAWACYDCGKCTASCPIARVGGDYSPRRHVLQANLGDAEGLIGNGSLFECLSCSLCDQRCPAEVAYTDLVLHLREFAFQEGAQPDCPHGGALQSIMRMMAGGGTQQDRMTWVGDELKTQTRQGEVFYWTGCTMYYDAMFKDYGVETLEGSRAAVRLMNQLGVTPVVSPEERCCGHDLLWNGDRENFELLAKHNVELVEESGAEFLVTSCAECLRTWKVDYEPFFKGKQPFIMHISEYLAEHLPELEFEENGGKRVTFHDPCRLGRHLDIYEAPRQLIEAIPGIELEEMGKSRRSATCCAGGTWSNCDRFAKQIQVDRLREARATGAEVMVTGCPKCQIHFRCAMIDPNIGDEIEIEMRDVAELAAAALS
jgi:Fe-S oxidoreductase